MMTVHEVSSLTGVSIRALQYYDRIGLLHPAAYSKAGYRLYDDAALEKLQLILLFRALEFPLKDIMEILNSPGFDYDKVLEQQITLLEMKKEHMENLINFARTIKMIGVRTLDFTVFDTAKIDEYTRQAKEKWGDTPAFKEFEEREKNRAPEDQQAIMAGLIGIFAEFGSVKELPPESPEAQGLVRKLRDYISDHMYQCTNEILYGLGKMYGGGGEFTKNINSYGGEGTAEFASKAIEIYCG